MAAIIRLRTDDDLPALAKVLVEVYAVDGYPVEGVDDPLAWLDLPNAIGAWTADLDGEAVGHVALTEPTESDEAPRLLAAMGSVEPTAVLGRLFVSPSSRGRRLAETLVRTAMRSSAVVGRRAVLDVMEKDEAALRLYRRLGWTTLGRFKHPYGRSGREPAMSLAAPRASDPRVDSVEVHAEVLQSDPECQAP